MISAPRRPTDRRFFFFTLAILVLTAGGHIVSGDEETMFQVTENLFRGQGLAIEREEVTLPAQGYALFLPAVDEVIWTTSAVTGVDGKLYAKYGLGQSLAALPLYALGALVDHVAVRGGLTLPPGWFARLAVSLLNPLAIAGCGWLMLQFGRELGYRPGTSRWLAAAAIFSTMLWAYGKTFYPQPGVAFLLLLVVYSARRWRVTRQRSWLWVLSAATAAGILFRLSAVIWLLPLGAYLIRLSFSDRRWDWVLPLLGGVSLALGVTAAYNGFRFGGVFATGYLEAAWTTPLLFGLYGLLFSPGKGVFLYAPLLVLNLVAGSYFGGQHRFEGRLIAGLWACYLVFYAPYSFWTGGFNWGPRFLLPVLPLAFLPLGTVFEEPSIRFGRWLFAALFALGLFLQIPSILVDHSRYLFQQFSEEEVSTAYTRTILEARYSPLVQQWPVALALVRAYRQTEPWEQARRSVSHLSQTSSRVRNGAAILVSEFLRRNTLDFWWLHFPLFSP